MDSDIDKFIGEWEDESGNRLIIRKKTEENALVTFLASSNLQPIYRPYYKNKSSVDMLSSVIDFGSTLEVELWEKERGFSLHLTYEYYYALDKNQKDSLVPGISRYEEDGFLDQYYELFGTLKHYTRRKSSKV